MSSSTSVAPFVGATNAPVRKRLLLGLRRISLSHFHRQRRVKDASPQVRPRLPPEVWGVVIHHACLMHHDPLDTSQDLTFLESGSTQLATYRAAMSTKCALTLVSRSWHAYARSYTYEFIWIRRAAQARDLSILLKSMPELGQFIRRIHIETPALQRCVPADLRVILDLAPHLTIYSDHHSLQRTTFDDPSCNPQIILGLVAKPEIRRLSWTSYHDDVPFQLRMSPLVNNITPHLEYLELSACSPNFYSVFADDAALDGIRMEVHLPALRALKVALDNDTFAVLATWDMPQLTHLSVLSSDFSYTEGGFSRFFQAHGHKLKQLELGHSSALVEEHYLSVSVPGRNRVPLATWCPNLRELICSADAQWQWQSPDWIAPHVLMPTHPTIQLIGIRDIDARLRDDPDFDRDTPYFSLLEQLSSLLREKAFPNLRFIRDLSTASQDIRMMKMKPKPRVLGFWEAIVDKCHQRNVWLEDCTGLNITTRNLLRTRLLADNSSATS